MREFAAVGWRYSQFTLGHQGGLEIIAYFRIGMFSCCSCYRNFYSMDIAMESNPFFKVLNYLIKRTLYLLVLYLP